VRIQRVSVDYGRHGIGRIVKPVHEFKAQGDKKGHAQQKEGVDRCGVDAGKIGQFVGAFKSELKEKSNVTIVYDSDKKETSVTTPSGSATLGGVDFMKAVWSIWFGKIDQPNLGDQLISKIP